MSTLREETIHSPLSHDIQTNTLDSFQASWTPFQYKGHLSGIWIIIIKTREKLDHLILKMRMPILVRLVILALWTQCVLHSLASIVRSIYFSYQIQLTILAITFKYSQRFFLIDSLCDVLDIIWHSGDYVRYNIYPIWYAYGCALICCIVVIISVLLGIILLPKHPSQLLQWHDCKCFMPVK